MRSLLFIILLFAIFVNVLSLGETKIVDENKTVALSNGLIELVIDKSTAEVISLKKGSFEYKGDLKVSCGYFQRNANHKYNQPKNCKYQLVRNSRDLVEVCFTEDDPDFYPFLFETHFVIKKDESGFYNFTIIEYDPSKISEAELEQLSLTWHLDPDMFTIVQISDRRWHVMPKPEDLTVPPSKMIWGANRLLDPSSAYYQTYYRVWTKYNMSSMVENLHVYGLCGDGGYGFWQILASNEYMNGGPTDQELTAHQWASRSPKQYPQCPYCVRIMTGQHYGSGKSNFNTSNGLWRKLYGPWFIYLNAGPDRLTMWEDAKSVADKHISQWPYQWMKNDNYPVKRARVSGKFTISGEKDLKDILVLLSAPETISPEYAYKSERGSRDWQRRGKGYWFSARTDSDGAFVIDKIRPGNYELYAIKDGVFDEYKYKSEISVSADEILDLGRLEWIPESHGKLIWQIGIPDRSPEEFRNGDDPRRWSPWGRYVRDFPDGIRFRIGSSIERRDWNYIQPAYQDESGSWKLPVWKILFDYDGPFHGEATLSVGVAGATIHSENAAGSLGKVPSGSGTDYAGFSVVVNGTNVGLVQDLINDSGAIRNGNRGYYRKRIVKFPASTLKEGENIIELKLSPLGGMPPSKNADYPWAPSWSWATIMYDCVRLEIDELSETKIIDKNKTIALSNGLIELVIDKPTAEVISLKKGSFEYKGNIKFSCGYFQRNANHKYNQPKNCKYQLVRNSRDLVEVCFTEDDPDFYPFLFETHFVIKKGESGFYNFTIIEYDPSKISEAELEQLSLTWRLDPDMFTIVQISDSRWEVLPTPEDLLVPPAKFVMKNSSSRLLEPSSAYYQTYYSVYTKYNMASMIEDLHVYGLCGDGGYGLWQILASNEYVNGGPTDQELTAHQWASLLPRKYPQCAYCVRIMTGQHYGSGKSNFNTSNGLWRKLYGPWFIYLNTGPDRLTMWEDAKSVADKHISQWPYQWMKNDNYPVKRARVSGKFTISGEKDLKNILVLLSAPETISPEYAYKSERGSRDWQRRGKGYWFSARTDSGGTFVIDKIRPGNYELYAIKDGVFDEYKYKSEISVSADEALDLGRLEWIPKSHGKLIWQIGIPDRSSGEFRNGDDPRRWSPWGRYVRDFPDGVRFRIGSSIERRDWNYIQPAYQDESGSWKLPVWKILFDYDGPFHGEATLSIGIAGTTIHSENAAGSPGKLPSGSGTDYAGFSVVVNGTNVGLVQDLINDESGERNGNRGYYRKRIVKFSAGTLKDGENIIELKLSPLGGVPSSKSADYPGALSWSWATIMYDCIRLEIFEEFLN